jgi:hypothetical protein
MFTNRTVIVTGGAQGIGKGIALAFAGQKGKVVIADINQEAGSALEKEMKEQGLEAFFVRTDVREEKDVIRLMEAAVSKFGRIDVLINNAGISVFKPFFELTVEEWDNVLNTNLRGAFLCTREAAKYMKKEGGSVINIASTRAFMSEPNTESYSASKGGIVALTHAMAASLSPDRIRVNSISPGWIHTGDEGELREADHRQHWSGRVGRPEDIARACLFLADSRNDFLTGENLIIDGGMTRKMIYVE